MSRLLWLLALSGMVTGCGSPMVGIWVSDKTLGNGEKNELVMYSDGTGEGEIYAAPENLQNDPNAFVRLDYDITWQEKGSEYELEMECDDGPCNGDDFDMDCYIIEEPDGLQYLDCESNDDKWKNYIFNFQREQ